MSKIKIALVQMHVEKDKYKNLETANTFIKKVAQEGCDLAILPEMFTTCLLYTSICIFIRKYIPFRIIYCNYQ